ncbi:hypothetical protein HWN40_01635 [Methanolobus zinderi]|uniref:Uncharacterized protein n=1 Tax=Methanolobus zinderi TaxID=536044 RepID=A0A7D5E6R1_9EURY|nr:hypothetical protein [Methanolobus zinderi]QLC49058.1 hypothetical protein HWN40_01635 [Methanolobus zinderi]
MTSLDVDQKTLIKNSVLIPIAFVTGTLIAVTAYKYLPPTTALISVFGSAIIVSLLTYALVKSRSK